jgi:hypothetical protein
MVVGYYMWKRQMSYEEAIDQIRQKRPQIDPNIGFVGQLMDLSVRFTNLRAMFWAQMN